MRGVHKESCPSFTPEDSWELDEKLEHLVEHILYQDARGFGIDSGIKRDWQDYFRTQIQKAEERGYQEGKKEADELTKAIHLYNTDGIKALKEAENRGCQEGLRMLRTARKLIEKVMQEVIDETPEMIKDTKTGNNICGFCGIKPEKIKAYLLAAIDTLLKEGKDV